MDSDEEPTIRLPLITRRSRSRGRRLSGPLNPGPPSCRARCGRADKRPRALAIQSGAAVGQRRWPVSLRGPHVRPPGRTAAGSRLLCGIPEVFSDPWPALLDRPLDLGEKFLNEPGSPQGAGQGNPPPGYCSPETSANCPRRERIGPNYRRSCPTRRLTRRRIGGDEHPELPFACASLANGSGTLGTPRGLGRCSHSGEDRPKRQGEVRERPNRTHC